MGEMKVVNLSRFLLFEEAGDSEEVNFDGKMVWDYHQDHAVEAIDDDAESCSSDVGCYGKSRDSQIEIPKQVFTETHFDDDDSMRNNNTHATGPYHHHHQHKLRAFEDEDEDENEGEDEDEDEDGMVSEVTSTANSHNSRKCVQPSNKDMSEMEKSRLFWETCLAS